MGKFLLFLMMATTNAYSWSQVCAQYGGRSDNCVKYINMATEEEINQVNGRINEVNNQLMAVKKENHQCLTLKDLDLIKEEILTLIEDRREGNHE